MTRPVLQVRLNLPYDAPPRELVANYRGHWAPKHKATAQVRQDVTNLARAAGLHRYAEGAVEHLTVQLVWAPGDRRRRDSTNLASFTKVLIDSLARGPRKDWVGIDLVPDDTPAYVSELPAVILPAPAPRSLRLDLWLRFADSALGRPERADTAASGNGADSSCSSLRGLSESPLGPSQPDPTPTERTPQP